MPAQPEMSFQQYCEPSLPRLLPIRRERECSVAAAPVQPHPGDYQRVATLLGQKLTYNDADGRDNPKIIPAISPGG